MRQERSARGVEHLVARLAREGRRQGRNGKCLVEDAGGFRIECARPLVAVSIAEDVLVAKLCLPFDRYALAIDVEAPGEGGRRVPILEEINGAGQLNREVPQRRLTVVRPSFPYLAVIARAEPDHS